MQFQLRSLVFTVLAATLFIVPLAGCGGSGDNAAVTDGADAAELAEYERLMEEAEEEANNDGSE